MASSGILSSSLNSVSGSGGPCGPGMIGGMSILRFGKSLPLVELFETFMITGAVLISVTGATYFTFRHMADILKAEGGSQTSVALAMSAASSQPIWIGVGLVVFTIGIILYYLHRRIITSPS